MFTALRQLARFGVARAPSDTARPLPGHRIRRAPLLFLSAALLALSPPQASAAQAGGVHTLFGDLKVDDSKEAGGLKPISFDLILYDIRGGMVSRQTVVVNGRYRFEDVRNGDYEIVVMMESVEIARVRVSVFNAVSTDVRRDISLEWKPPAGGKQPDKAGVASVAEHYERSPSNDRLFRSAEEAVKKKEYAQATGLLHQLVGADPKDFEAWTELGTVAFIRQDLPEADGSYRRALELRPTFGLALMNSGKLRMAQKDFKGAVEFLRRAVGARPKSADANLFLGEAYLNEALADIRQGSQAIDELNELARQAIYYLNEALRLDPVGKAELHLRLADIFNVLGMKGEAAAECEKFLAAKPDYLDRKKLEQFIKENKKK
jgi:tetratricopeptide (TPR) repeat protein